ncbi:hypothetical protein [Ureibacillus terrenus]|uniref:Uncharacterized protein n=1 Tax=Ureibacillus terrenus TaxID=118246 RepID=A0A540UVX9_9BACL|nr:hypothetical protein [Ureibacillus terrenus]TQE88650.1 hypothetical protein FKZ59_13495 [Ureibacillus terrenus]
MISDSYKPNRQDISEWIRFCEWLENQPRKAAYDVPNEYSHLVSQEKIFVNMRKWMQENDCDCIFWSSGWGWRLRKGWRERLNKCLK